MSTPAKRTLNAASVIGARFRADLLTALGIDTVVDELVERGADRSGALHTNLRIRLPTSVDSRGRLRIAAEIRSRPVAPAPGRRDPRAWPGSVEENAALIAEHCRPPASCTRRMAGNARRRVVNQPRFGAARVSWERARRIADALPDDDPDQLSMRIAPRTMLCATDFQARAVQESRGRFEELRELCSAAGDKVSLAIAMTALATELLYAGRTREGSRLASEQMALLESIGDPTLTVGWRA